MNEEEFDSFLPLRPFGTGEFAGYEDQLRRCITLGAALFGKTSDYLQRQLLAPYPEIPSGFDLDDFRALEKNIRSLAVGSGDPRFGWLPHGALSSRKWEARLEIVRRAIEYLEGR